jgi:predicted DNA binding CopG/RHH family protein
MSKIPKIDSIEDLAKFWDTHDITDFEGELEEVREPVFDRGAEAVVRIRLPSEQAAALKRIARSKGMDEADLVEEWVSEKLRAS